VPLHSPHSPRADPPPTTTPPLSLHAALPIYPGASPCPGADSSAVGGEGADAGLLVDGHQVGEGEGPAEGLVVGLQLAGVFDQREDRKSTRLNSSHVSISYAVFCLKKKRLHTL